MKTLHNTAVKVTIEVIQTVGYCDHKTIAKAVVEDSGTFEAAELAGKISEVTEQALGRAQRQLDNAQRIADLEERNRLLQTPLKEIT